jgi:hypothetical protein
MKSETFRVWPLAGATIPRDPCATVMRPGAIDTIDADTRPGGQA